MVLCPSKGAKFQMGHKRFLTCIVMTIDNAMLYKSLPWTHLVYSHICKHGTHVCWQLVWAHNSFIIYTYVKSFCCQPLMYLLSNCNKPKNSVSCMSTYHLHKFSWMNDPHAGSSWPQKGQDTGVLNGNVSGEKKNCLHTMTMPLPVIQFLGHFCQDADFSIPT